MVHNSKGLWIIIMNDNFFQGTLYEDGSEFDSSIPRGEPLTFTLGAGMVIKGWDQGLLG